MIDFNQEDISDLLDKIFCGVTIKQWERFQKKSFHLPMSFESEGFIHCCLFDQLKHVSEKHFKEDKYNLLVMNKSLGELLIYEGEGELFPHLYRKINKLEVVKVIHILRVDQASFKVLAIEEIDV